MFNSRLGKEDWGEFRLVAAHGLLRDFFESPRSRSTPRQVAVFALHRRTLRRTIGTKDAAVAGFGAQQRLTGSTFVEKLAGLDRHCFTFGEAANGAHQH